MQPFSPEYGNDRIAIVVMDHGSRHADFNQMLDRFAAPCRAITCCRMVEPAHHMALTEPFIATGVKHCVHQGVRCVAVTPSFLAPGKHWREDLPRLTAEAARYYSGIEYLVTAPIALPSSMRAIVNQRSKPPCMVTMTRPTMPCHARPACSAWTQPERPM